MIKISPKFVYDEAGKKVGVVLSAKEFEKCIDVLEDYQDCELVRVRSGKKEKCISLEKVIEQTLQQMKK